MSSLLLLLFVILIPGCIVGFVFSLIGVIKKKRSALPGLIISSIGIVILLVLIILLFARV